LPPFTILNVCVGNICRSPMAERLLAAALRKRLGDTVDARYLSHGAGTGSWHVGQPMEDGAARTVASRGGDPSGFRARRVTGELIDMSDLVLTATGEQVEYVLGLRADAEARTFVLGEFGRLLSTVDLSGLPPADSAATAYARGVDLVAAVDAARSDGRGGRRPSRPRDDLFDPYGMPDKHFARAADAIEQTVRPLADALLG
jgi:protein-tyrosine phosphatase